MKRISHLFEIEWILSLDKDDPKLSDYLAIPVRVNAKVIRENRSVVDAVNNGAKEAKGNIFIVISDDFVCPYLWDEVLMRYLDGKEDYVAKTQDGTQGWIITLPIMDRKFYERFGYIYNPLYTHMFCDTEMTSVGDLLGKTVKINEVFEHVHPSTGKVKRDALNIRNDKTWNQGREVYLTRWKNNFDLKLCDIKGRITDEEHLKWVQRELSR